VRRGFSPAAVAAFLTTLLVLAVVGWSIGWLAAGTDLAGNETLASASPSTPASRPPSSAPASPSPSASAGKDAFGMPKLVGQKFRLARQKAFDLKLGVTIHFDEPGNYQPGTVARTYPADGILVRPGYTIVLYVTGPAPKVSVPAVAGMTCSDGKDALVDAGLRIDSYPSGDKGRVVKTDPPGLVEVTWNDAVKVYCTQVGASP
jgi:hypothetical protein